MTKLRYRIRLRETEYYQIRSEQTFPTARSVEVEGAASAVVRAVPAAAEAPTVVRVAATAVAATVAVAAMAAAAAAATVAAVVTADVSEIHRCLRRGNGIRCPSPPARNQLPLRNHRHHVRNTRYCTSTTHTSHLLRRPRLRSHPYRCNSNLRLARRWIQQDNRDPNACNDSVSRVEQAVPRGSYFLPKPTHLPCRHRI